MGKIARGARCTLALVCLGGCVGDSPNTSDGGVDASTDSAVDAKNDGSFVDVVDAGSDVASTCDSTKAWTAPQLISGVNSTDAEVSPRLSWDELTIFFASNRSDASASGSGMQLMMAHRASTSAAFDPPSDLPVVNQDTVYDADPMVSKDGLALFFASARNGQTDVWLATRTSPAVDFGVPGLVAQVNSSDWDDAPFLSADGNELWLRSFRDGGAGGSDLYRATGTVTAGFSTAARITELATADDDSNPVLSADGLTIYFASTRADGNAKGKTDIWTATRATLQAPFQGLKNVAELNTSSFEAPGWISPDNCRMYLSSERGGNSDLYVATRAP